MSTTSKGLLCVFSQCEPDVPTKDYNDWYDNEHAPARLTVPGFNSATRYKASDGEEPEWIALYDLESPEIAKSPEYLRLREIASDNERSLLPRLPILQRRVYLLVTQSVKDASTPLPSKYLHVRVWGVDDETSEENFRRWYEEEHQIELAEQPGWLRGRLYKLDNSVDLVPRAGPPVGSYITIDDWDRGDYLTAPEQTPWSKKMVGSVKLFNSRKYELYKNF